MQHNKKTDDSTLDMKAVNTLIKKLLSLKDKRNNLLLDPPKSFAPDRISNLAASYKAEIEQLESDIQKMDMQLAAKYKDRYHTVNQNSPSFLELRSLKSNNTKLKL